MHDLETGIMSCNDVASTYDIPEPILRRYVKRMKENIDFSEHYGRYRQTFNATQTKEFVDYVKEFSD